MKKSRLLLLATSALMAFTAFASGCKEENITYGDWIITNFPTETASGTAKRVSADGTKTEEISIPSVSDTSFWTKVSEKAPTHSLPGEAVYECEYGKATVAIKPLGHDYDGVIATVTVMPTEESEGKAVFVCKDGDGQDEVVLPVLGSKEYTVVEAGHTTPGTATFECEFGSVEIELAPTGHTFKGNNYTITQAPTLTEKGKGLHLCDKYNHEEEGEKGFVEVEIPALSDSEEWNENEKRAVAPTHTEEGKRVFTSATYGTIELVVPALGHDYETDHKIEVVTMPTLNQTGKAIEYCADYETEEEGKKGSREIEIPVLTDQSVWTVEKTVYHTKKGKAVYTSVYGTVELELEPVGHDYTREHKIEMTVSPTLNETGTAIEYCSDYDSEEGEEKGKQEIVVPALSDKTVWTLTAIAPTHTKDGAYVYTSVYGEVTQVVKATGHNYIYDHKIEVLVAPTLTESGTAIEYCASYDQEEEKGTREIVIPELSNARVWTKTTLAPDYYHGTRDVYSSIYGEVVIEHDDRVLLPYENKYYKSVMLNAYGDNAFGSEYARGAASFDTTWANNAPFYLGADGTGVGEAHPFTVGTKYEFYDYDMLTGRVTIKVLPQSARTITDEDGNVTTEHYYDESKATTEYAYIDFATGIMIKPAYKDYNYSVIATPYADAIDAVKSTASVWNKAIAMSLYYNDGEEKTLNVFILDGKVYFGATFADINGNAVAAKDCYGAENLYVMDKNGSLIASFGWNGSDMTELDGLEGEYAGAEKIFISGTGFIKKDGAIIAKYTVIDDKTIGVTAIDGRKYEVYTLDLAAKTYEAKLPTVTVEYDLGGVTLANEDAFAGLTKTEKGYKNANFNQNTVLTTVTPEAEGKVFFGWKTADGKTFTSGTVVSENLVLVADWRDEVVLYYLDAEGVKHEIKAAEGVRIGDYLPVLEDRFDSKTLKYYQFAGWNIGGNDIPLDTPVAKGAAGRTLEATWKELSAYVGTYNGTEIYNGGYGNSANKTLTISEDGKISGTKTGTIVSYDPASGRITWKDGNNKECYFWFDVKSGVIAGLYNDTKIGNDLYIFGNAEYQTSNKMASSYGVWDPDTRTWEAQFARVNTRNGLTDVFMYKNHIYSNVSVTDAAGNKLEIAEIKNSKTVVVTDLDSNEVLIRIATTAANFGKGNSSSSNKALDQWAGSYAFGEEKVALDGTGTITYGDKTGTYEKVEGKDYDFDVYFGETEYWRLTLDGKNCTMVKPMVTLTFDLGGKTVSEEDAAKVVGGEVNANIGVTLPELSNIDGFVFRGWYLDPMFVEKVSGTFVPEKNVTLYANWMQKRTLTVVLGENNSYVQEYALGEKTVVENPAIKGLKFLGWYTTATFEKGTEWNAGSALNENVTVYAKWTEAPAYNNVYVATELRNKNDNRSDQSNIYTRNSAVLDVNPDGEAKCDAYPFRGDVSFKETETYALDGAVVIVVGGEEHPGFIDKNSGIVIMTYGADAKATFKEAFFLNPFEKGSLYLSKLPSSYWLDGEARAVEYTFDNKTYTAFIMGDKVYFGVSFKDEAGKTVKADVAYKSESVFVYAADGTLIAKYVSDGEELCLTDGFEGEYKLEGEENASAVLNGVKKITLSGVEGTYFVVNEKGYNVEAYVDGAYYRLNVNKTAATYSITKPMATVSYNLSNVAIETPIAVRESKNYNIAYKLPHPTSRSYMFRGWYTRNDESTLYTDEYVPSGDVMLYAKWDRKVILTVVYGNGLESKQLEYGEGDVTAPETPGYINGKVFNGWFTDEACTKAYTPGKITENTTIYCKWIEAVPYFGDYVGYNIYGTSGNGTIGTSSVKASIDALGKASGKFSGTITKDANGNYKLGSSTPIMIDEVNGIIVTPYNTNNTTIGTDWYVYIKNASSYSGNKANDQFIWNNGNTKLTRLTVKYTDGTTKEMIIFFHGGKVYGNVTWQCEGVSVIGKLTAANLDNLVVKDCNGNVVFGE